MTMEDTTVYMSPTNAKTTVPPPPTVYMSPTNAKTIVPPPPTATCDDLNNDTETTYVTYKERRLAYHYQTKARTLFPSRATERSTAGTGDLYLSMSEEEKDEFNHLPLEQLASLRRQVLGLISFQFLFVWFFVSFFSNAWEQTFLASSSGIFIVIMIVFVLLSFRFVYEFQSHQMFKWLFLFLLSLFQSLFYVFMGFFIHSPATSLIASVFSLIQMTLMSILAAIKKKYAHELYEIKRVTLAAYAIASVFTVFVFIFISTEINFSLIGLIFVLGMNLMITLWWIWEFDAMFQILKWKEIKSSIIFMYADFYFFVILGFFQLFLGLDQQQ